MSPLTLFLARLIGVYCVVVALTMLLRRRETIATVETMIGQPGQIMIAGVIALSAGVAMILGHNLWSGGAVTIAVTLVGWVAALKGALLLALPGPRLRQWYGLIAYDRLFIVYMVGTLTLGAWLTFVGFTG
jgi:hypothetical protein